MHTNTKTNATKRMMMENCSFCFSSGQTDPAVLLLSLWLMTTHTIYVVIPSYNGMGLYLQVKYEYKVYGVFVFRTACAMENG